LEIVINTKSGKANIYIRLGGLYKIGRGILKYVFSRILIEFVMIDPTRIDDLDFISSSTAYYLYGFFLYLIVAQIGDFGFGFYRIVFGIEMFDSPFSIRCLLNYLTFSSPRDFWSNRWNRLFSHCFRRIIFRFRPRKGHRP
jgi:hypothetical protein